MLNENTPEKGTPEQKILAAIVAARELAPEPDFEAWSQSWINGSDRSRDSAWRMVMLEWAGLSSPPEEVGPFVAGMCCWAAVQFALENYEEAAIQADTACAFVIAAKAHAHELEDAEAKPPKP